MQVAPGQNDLTIETVHSRTKRRFVFQKCHISFAMRGFNLMHTSCVIYIRFLHQEHDKSFPMERRTENCMTSERNIKISCFLPPSSSPLPRALDVGDTTEAKSCTRAWYFFVKNLLRCLGHCHRDALAILQGTIFHSLPNAAVTQGQLRARHK